MLPSSRFAFADQERTVDPVVKLVLRLVPADAAVEPDVSFVASLRGDVIAWNPARLHTQKQLRMSEYAHAEAVAHA